MIEWSEHCGINNDGTMESWTSAIYFNNLYCNIILSSSVVSYIVTILLHSDLSACSVLKWNSHQIET